MFSAAVHGPCTHCRTTASCQLDSHQCCACAIELLRFSSDLQPPCPCSSPKKPCRSHSAPLIRKCSGHHLLCCSTAIEIRSDSVQPASSCTEQRTSHPPLQHKAKQQAEQEAKDEALQSAHRARMPSDHYIVIVSNQFAHALNIRRHTHCSTRPSSRQCRRPKTKRCSAHIVPEWRRRRPMRAPTAGALLQCSPRLLQSSQQSPLQLPPRCSHTPCSRQSPHAASLLQ